VPYPAVLYDRVSLSSRVASRAWRFSMKRRYWRSVCTLISGSRVSELGGSWVSELMGIADV
jgi:hypothetical protein